MRLRRLFLLLLFGLLLTYQALGQETRNTAASSISQNESLRNLTAQILKDAPEVGCFAHECKMLVLDFGMPNGVNPAYGGVLADELSRQLADSQKELGVFDRGLLKAYAAIAKPSSTLPKGDGEARELASGLGANTVVVGSAAQLYDGSLKLSVRLLNAKDASFASRADEAVVPPPPATPPEGIHIPSNPAEPSASSALPSPSRNKKFAIPGRDGVSSPVCSLLFHVESSLH